jgi:hypothetical protein
LVVGRSVTIVALKEVMPPIAVVIEESTYYFVAASISAVGAAPRVSLPANVSLPDQSKVRALERPDVPLPLPTISTYLPRSF